MGWDDLLLKGSITSERKGERIFVSERNMKESLNAVKGNKMGTELVPLSDFGKGTEILSSF